MTSNDVDTTQPLTFDKPTRTDMSCQCGRTFVALLDYQINGNHVIECPHCGHEHCRVIINGTITGDRWSSRFGNDKSRDRVHVRRTWKSTVLQANTSAASHFIRQKWLDREN